MSGHPFCTQCAVPHSKAINAEGTETGGNLNPWVGMSRTLMEEVSVAGVWKAAKERHQTSGFQMCLVGVKPSQR